MSIFRTGNNSEVPVVYLPDGTATNHYNMAIALTSTATAALPAGAYRVSPSVDSYIVRNAAATTAHAFMLAGSSEHFAVNAGDTINIIGAAVVGTASITKVI